MKRIASFVFLIIVCFAVNAHAQYIANFITPPNVPAGQCDMSNDPGTMPTFQPCPSQGPSGNTIWNGTTEPPSSTLGQVGDFYLDTANATFWGPKTASGWPSSGTSLVGPIGATGAIGPTGPQGTFPQSLSVGSSGTFFNHNTTDPTDVPSQPDPVGGSQWTAVSNYNDNSAGSLAQFNSLIYTSGSRYAAAINGSGFALTGTAAAWGANLVGGAAAAGAHAEGAQIEGDAFAAGTNVQTLILSVGGDATAGHNTTSQLSFQSNAAGNSPTNLITLNGNYEEVQPGGSFWYADSGVSDAGSGLDWRNASFNGCGALCLPDGTSILGNGQITMFNNTTLNWPYITFGYAGGGSPGTLGSIINNGSGVSYTTVSDRRLKKNIENLDIGSLFSRLHARSFIWRKSDDPGAGFVAQEVYAAIPHAVELGLVSKGNVNQNIKPGEPGFKPWAVDESKLVPYLWAEIDALRTRLHWLFGIGGFLMLWLLSIEFRMWRKRR